MPLIHVVFDTARPAVWQLTHDHARATDVGVVTGKAGFVSDMASVPRFLQDRFSPWGPYASAALVHDFLYCAKPIGVSREGADGVFLALMLIDGVDRQMAEMMHWAVRRFGQWAWDSPDSPGQVALVSVVATTEGEMTELVPATSPTRPIMEIYR